MPNLRFKSLVLTLPELSFDLPMTLQLDMLAIVVTGCTPFKGTCTLPSHGLQLEKLLAGWGVASPYFSTWIYAMPHLFLAVSKPWFFGALKPEELTCLLLPPLRYILLLLL